MPLGARLPQKNQTEEAYCTEKQTGAQRARNLPTITVGEPEEELRLETWVP